MNIYSNIEKWFVIFDQKPAARFFVLIMPGIIATKMSMGLDAPKSMQLSSTALLGLGVAGYAFWGAIRKRFFEEELEAEEIEIEESVATERAEEVPPANVHLELMAEMLNMFGGDLAQVYNAVQAEAQLHPLHSYLYAIELAHARKKLEIKRLVGN